ncbi:hypothetical protein PBAL39_24570 [Pedobacter sp. BAL39]|uniref:DUF4369 domain-containing protein n=1 Tax=Pedobacter sp. BAL39 TaxID=391596 RepID=UPI0001559AE6|nr:DUF4369 domain-containing protein [Pedobacter sp. BAL39]EDM36500.1 hypothetical protein PBAL39_24570 [Pedobacter sp. BAL39]
MRYILLNVLLFLSFLAKAQELEFSGKLDGLQENTKVILTDLRSLKSNSTEKRFHDTAVVSDGMFKFKAKLPGAGLYLLRVALIGQNPEHRKFYLDGGKVQLDGQRGALNKAILTSDAPYMRDYIRFTEVMDAPEVFARKKALTDTSMMKMAETGSYDGFFNTPGLMDKLMKVEKEARDKSTEIAAKWIADHPGSDINAYVIQTYLGNDMDDKAVKQAILKLSPGARRSVPGKILLNIQK